jgi:hypothetical protein
LIWDAGPLFLPRALGTPSWEQEVLKALWRRGLARRVTRCTDRTLQSQAASFGEWRLGDFALHIAGKALETRVAVLAATAARSDLDGARAPRFQRFSSRVTLLRALAPPRSARIALIVGSWGDEGGAAAAAGTPGVVEASVRMNRDASGAALAVDVDVDVTADDATSANSSSFSSSWLWPLARVDHSEGLESGGWFPPAAADGEGGEEAPSSAGEGI